MLYEKKTFNGITASIIGLRYALKFFLNFNTFSYSKEVLSNYFLKPE